MHCVNCGNLLSNGNQAGLVCQPCKQAQQRKRRGEEKPVAIYYCFRCGKPYHPDDASIQHLSCSPGLFSSEPEETPKVRRENCVLL